MFLSNIDFCDVEINFSQKVVESYSGDDNNSQVFGQAKKNFFRVIFQMISQKSDWRPTQIYYFG
jgi:hypothetical protein